MKLLAVNVRNFKCVLDSGWFDVAPLTALVGKNESGKTALLEAIEKLNAVEKGRGRFHSNDYPRILSIAEGDSAADRIAIESRWELSDEEVFDINELVGTPVLKSNQVTVKKGYDNTLSWDIDVDHAAAVNHLMAESGLSATDRNPIKTPSTVHELINQLKGLSNPTPRHQTFLTELTGTFPKGSLTSAVKSLLETWLPTFVYYSSYDRLPGRVSLNQLVAHRSGANVPAVEGSKVFTALLSMVGTNPEEIKDIGRSEDLISKLETVQAQISRRVFKYWSQNKHLKVRFDYRQASPDDPAPFNDGFVFQTRIENQRHEATINLDERSTGFIWFFSFLVWFSEVTAEFGDNLVVLLDEPGLSLHGRAQFDLLRFIKEELLSKYQVIYTTHSPFMIDPADLLACRTVEDVVTDEDVVLGTKVRDDVLATDRDTLFPLQAALGYDITQSLFIGEHTLLVEGPSDLLYLQWASAELGRQGRTALNRRWTVTPCGGLPKVSSFLALFGGNTLHVAVLTDYAHGEKAKVRELKESDLLRDGHVFTADMYVIGASEADTEDILGRDFYVDLVNATYDLHSTNALSAIRLDSAPQRVTLEVKQHFQTLPPTVPEYDHYAPSEYLLKSEVGRAWNGQGVALDRFEQLFKDLNALL